MNSTVEPHSLLTDEPKVILIPDYIEKLYDSWKNKRKNATLSELECFYAGYILSNPILRERFIKPEV